MRRKLSFEEIDCLAEKIASYVQAGTFIALLGDLGTGKTHFSQCFARALGVKEALKSPTFNYVLSYESGRLPLFHFDVYRLGEPEELYELGYEDYLEEEGIILMEWADIVASELPKEYIKISLSYAEEEDRRYVDLEYLGNPDKEEELKNYVDFRN